MPNRSRSGALSIAKRVDKLRLAGISVLLVVPILLISVRWRMLMRANGFDVALADDDVEGEVLHRRVEHLLDDAVEPVHLVDEEHVALLKTGQDGG